MQMILKEYINYFHILPLIEYIRFGVIVIIPFTWLPAFLFSIVIKIEYVSMSLDDGKYKYSQPCRENYYYYYSRVQCFTK